MPKKEKNKRIEHGKPAATQTPLDPYTGEAEPLAEDANKVTEVVPVDSGDREGEDFLLEEETPLDKVAVDAQADVIGEQMGHYTNDEEVEAVFEERQNFAPGGRWQLEEKLDEYHAQSPDVTADDIDAAWEDSIASGDESVGGMASTPRQDVVDEIGGALGITYEDDEPLGGEEKFQERDRHRLEPEGN